MAFSRSETPLARKLHPLSTREVHDLAALADTTYIQICRWVKGETHPYVTNAIKLARVLDCTVEELFPVEEA